MSATGGHGDGRFASRAALACLAALALVSLLIAAPARAEHKGPVFDFGSRGSQGGQFSDARGIAVNETGAGGVPAGTVYVADGGNDRVQSLEATGEFIRAWGWDTIMPGRPGDGGEGFEICEGAFDCKAGIRGPGAGQLTSPAGGIAVDQTSGDVYVVEQFINRVQQFSATGAFVRAWGWDVVPGGGEGFEICEAPAECKRGVPGSGAGQFRFNTGIAGIGVDEAGGVYVAENLNRRVQKFDSEGNFLRMGGFDVVEEGPNETPADEWEVCVPAEGDVCKVGVAGTAPGQFASGINCCPNYLTVSPAGDVFTVGRSDGTVYRLAPSLDFGDEYPATAGGGAEDALRSALAFDAAASHLLFAKRFESEIFELDPASGLVVHEYPADAPYTSEADGDEWVGLAIDSSSGRVFADRTTSAGFIRAIDEPVVLPVAQIEAPEPNSWTTATLVGTVDPEGVELTRCRFEYGPTTAYGQQAPCAEYEDPLGSDEWVPLEDPSQLGEGSAPVSVRAGIAGLTPNNAPYNARLRTTNAEGPGVSENEPFQTPEAVVTEPAGEPGATAVTLNGAVDPLGEAVSDCRFRYAPLGSFEAQGFEGAAEAPCAESPAAIPVGEGPVAVHAEVGGLVPGTAYRFELRAANALDGTVAGETLGFQSAGAVLGEAWTRSATSAEATLRAKIDPEGDPTSFRVQYGTSAAYGQATAELPVGSDSEVHTVGALLRDLQPRTSYHWRVVATNRCNEADPEEECVSVGPDHTLHTYAETPAGPDPCPNAALRAGPGARLPDCRAYELVSPLDKGGLDAQTIRGTGGSEGSYYRSTPAGSALTYSADGAFAEPLSAPQISQYLARRAESAPHEGGWASEALNSPRVTLLAQGAGLNPMSPFRDFSPDLCQSFLRHAADPPLELRAPAGTETLYMRRNCGAGAGDFEAITREEAEEPYEPWPSGASADWTRFAYSADAPLTEDACEPPKPPKPPKPPNRQTYLQLAEEAGPRLVSVLPDGSCSELDSDAGGGHLGSGRISISRNMKGAVSADGSRVYWTQYSPSSTVGRLYLRLNATDPPSESGECGEAEPQGACTLAVSEDVSGEDALFWQARPDGSAALFTIGETLYAFDLASRTAAPIASGVQGLAGASDDLERVYLVSTLAEPDGEPLGPNSEGDEAIEGEPNLYLYEQGEGFRFVARVDGESAISADTDAAVHAEFPEFRRTRVSADGEKLAFAAWAALTDYDNTDQSSGAADREVYLYDAAGAGKLTCVSCNPSGARPRGAPYSEFLGGEERYPLAAQIPAHQNNFYPRRVMSTDGKRLYFEALDPLLPTDTNGALDVYQWQAPGKGDCTTASHDYFAQNGGCLALISTGTGSADARFVESDADGSDVFFRTDLSLYGPDPGLIDVYDAREGGGFHPPPPPPASCEGEACQSPPGAPEYRTPASEAYEGAGDLSASPASRCARPARKAKRLSKRAKALRKGAKRAQAPPKARRMRGKARRLARGAKKQSSAAKRCRRRARAARRAGR